jgi:cyclophilin family peptidyl-prolyl cis-trans isomerase
MQFWSVFVAILLFSTSASHAGVLAIFKINAAFGPNIEVELFDQDKPATVANFIRYIRSGAWHDAIVERWEPNFVLQGGSFVIPHRDDLLTPFTIDPTQINGSTIPFERDIGRFFSNTFGTIAMARVGTDTNSASSSWFINIKDNTNLDTQDGGYTVFGRTIRGTNTLNYFNLPTATSHVFWYSANDHRAVYAPDQSNPLWVNLDITLLTAQIAQVQGGNQISWNSVEGRPNIVESSSTFPPTWQTVQTVTGTGATMSIIDDPGRALVRYYRVRIDYTQ